MTEKERYEKMSEAISDMIQAIKSLNFETRKSWGYSEDPYERSYDLLESAEEKMKDVLKSFGDEQ